MHLSVLKPWSTICYMIFFKQFVFVYLDDILIFSRGIREHGSHVRQVLQRLLENKLDVKADKCQLHASSSLFLGYIVEAGKVRADLEKITAVKKWPQPGSRKQLQWFLRFANFYQQFIKNFSQVAAPLTKLISPVVPFGLSPEVEQVFGRLKQLFVTAFVLVQPDTIR